MKALGSVSVLALALVCPGCDDDKTPEANVAPQQDAAEPDEETPEPDGEAEALQDDDPAPPDAPEGDALEPEPAAEPLAASDEPEAANREPAAPIRPSGGAATKPKRADKPTVTTRGGRPVKIKPGKKVRLGGHKDI